jgi:3-phosphoshikimate 1-carboxyvinyltransferase
MATIIESLKELGAKVYDRGTGRLPFMISATGELLGARSRSMHHGRVSSSPDSCSAARFNTGVTVHHVGDSIPSMPHIDMTVAMLAEHGVPVLRSGTDVWHVDPHSIAALDRSIEPDLSNAAPFLAAALVCGGTVTVPHWPSHTTQAGDELRDILARMGADVKLTDDGLVVTGTGDIDGIDIDLHHAGELVPAVVALAALAQSPTRISGIAHLRGHESDRLSALRPANNLGGDVTGPTTDSSSTRLHGEFLTTDHRMATAGALIGLRVPGVEVEDIATTGKTIPDFARRWADMLGDDGTTAPTA